MKKRWKILLGVGGLMIAAALTPIIYIEAACSPAGGGDGEKRQPLIRDPAWQRGEARTWLTYPEWYIVYSADSFGRFLDSKPPSAFPYWRHVRGFWSGYCAVNQVAPSDSAGDAKVMLYTIGLSYSAELLVKAAYENSIGRLFEWIGGWGSADDRYAARVQQRYGAFMHEQPWYIFPFGEAFSRLWDTKEPDARVRHWERRLALSAEYGVKNGYAALIGWASGATLGPDERSLRFVAHSTPQAIRAVDPRLRPVARVGDAVVVEAPRYAQFSELLGKLAATRTDLIEISGNDDIFLTLLMPSARQLPSGSDQLLAMPLDDRPGWSRVGVTTKVDRLLPLMRAVRRSGGEVEHVYDY